jgi:hypothetical protein
VQRSPVEARLQNGIVEVGDELDAWNIELRELFIAREKEIDSGRGCAGQMNRVGDFQVLA